MKRMNYSAQYKINIILEVLREEELLGAIAARHNLNPNMVRNWKKEFLEKLPLVFDKSRQERELMIKERELESERNELLKTIGQLTMECDWLKKNQQKHLGPTTRRSLIKSHPDITVERQCELLGVNVSTYYYKPKEKPSEQLRRDEAMRNAIDCWHTAMPYLGCRRLVAKLLKEGLTTHRKEVRRYMVEMGIYAVYPKPNLSKKGKQHRVYPYLLRNKVIFLPNQVWSVDITYIKMKQGHMYLTAIIDWHSRYIVGWALADALSVAPVLEAVKFTVKKHGVPSIINSDQGSQFTSEDYTSYLKKNGIRQSMDGKARWIDNVIIERWFRSLKHEDIYINEYYNPRKLRAGITAYIEEYNQNRPHQSLGYAAPADIYLSSFATEVTA